MKKYLFYIAQNYSLAILRPVQTVLLGRGDQVYWFIEGNSVNRSYLAVEEKIINSVEEIFDYQPDAVLAPANSVPTFIPGLKVAVFHGFDPGKVDSQGHNDHFKIRGCFDLYCTQGPSTTEVFNQMKEQHQFFNVIETGWPTLDPLFKSNNDKTTSDKPTVLLCSTFSKRLSCAKTLFPMVKKINASQKYQWLVQFHPKMDQDTIQQYKAIQNEQLRFIETDNVIPLLQQADVMVCDTSSVIDMFLIQGKPVVTYKNIRPGPHLLDIDNPNLLEKNIDTALNYPEPLMKAIQHFIQRTHPYNDGHSAQRVVAAIDSILAGQHPVKQKKPANLIRNLKFRKRLGYWKT